MIPKIEGIAAAAFILLFAGTAVCKVKKCPYKCDRNATCVQGIDQRWVCQCDETLIGNGWPHQCHDLKAVVQAECLYRFPRRLSVSGPHLPYGEVVRQVTDTQSLLKWCEGFKTVEAFLKNCPEEDQPVILSHQLQLTTSYLRDKLTVADCALALQSDIACPDEAVQDEYYGDSGLALQIRSFFESSSQPVPRSEFKRWLDLINLEGLLMKLMGSGMKRKLVLKRWGISFFDKEQGIPALTMLHLNGKLARGLKALKRRRVMNKFFKEPDLDKQGSAELYSDSGWDRGRAIYSELLRFTDRGVQETQSYAFILPMARRLNRVDWLEMEDVLVGHLATSFADNDGEILVFTGTSDMEAQIVSNNGKQMLKMTKGPEIYLGDEEEPTRIRIPNLIWTLVVSIHYARNSDSRPERIETIAYFGNNSEERSKAITIAIPFEIADKLLGVSALNDDAVRNLKIQHTEKNFTPILPMATE